MKRFVLMASLRLFVVLALAAAGSAATFTLFDNTAATPETGATDLVPVTANSPFASFSTDIHSGILFSLTLDLEAPPTSGGVVNVGLYSDSSTNPGSLIASLGSINDSDLTSSPGLVHVALATNPVLNSGTRYWIGLIGGDSSADWLWTESTTGIGVAGEFYNSAGVTLSNDEGPFIMDVEISGDAPAPEPSTVGLGALALLGLAATRLRRRSS